jgi:hypothetical protein
MDVHKDTIVVAVTATGEVGKSTAYGTFPNTAAGLEKLVKRLRHAGGGPLKFCYEAGPCGYGIHRALTKMGEDCMVSSGSMPSVVMIMWAPRASRSFAVANASSAERPNLPTFHIRSLSLSHRRPSRAARSGRSASALPLA